MEANAPDGGTETPVRRGTYDDRKESRETMPATFRNLIRQPTCLHKRENSTACRVSVRAG